MRWGTLGKVLGSSTLSVRPLKSDSSNLLPAKVLVRLSRENLYKVSVLTLVT